MRGSYSIELAYSKNSKRIESLSLLDKPKDHINGDRQICVHLNGSIQNAIPEDLDSKIRLSDASYLSSDFFLDSKWRTVFNRDLEHSSAIVFVGYSLYDFDIEKILNDRPHLFDKTYFIVHDSANHQLTYKLSSYGHISKIGTEGFGKLVADVILDTSDFLMPECFTKRIVSEVDHDLSDVVTQSMLLYGKYENTDVDTAVRKSFSIPYMFERRYMEEICNSLMEKKHIFVQSELGNGKSVLLNQVASAMSSYGYSVWEMTNFEGNSCKDLDIFASEGEHIVVIDDVIDQKDFFDYYTSIQPANITFLLADRTVNALKNVQVLGESGVELKIFGLDALVDQEIEQLITILEDQNLWKQYTGWNHKKKIELIKEGYNSQLANILLDLLKSPDIKRRITFLLEEITSNSRHKKTLFVIALCDIFGIRKELGNISDIVGHEDIFTSTFQKTNAFSTIFSIDSGNNIKTKSSVLSLFIVNTLLSENYVVETSLEIMERIDNREEFHLKLLHSKLRRFSNIEKLLPQKQSHLNNYFVELKRRCTWLRYHPHFWVQYAMCRLSFGDTATAQEHLNTAYEFAAQKTSGTNQYHTENIDTQQARLYLMDACEKQLPANEIAERFELCHKLLLTINNDNHKFRQVIKYEKFHSTVYERLNPGKKAFFEHACIKMLEDANKAKSEAIATDRTNFIQIAIKTLSNIVDSIKETR